jgi:ATP-dependent protease ClpP protease subunit
MYQGNTIGISTDSVHSAASMILQACKVRKMTVHATMIIHNPSRLSVSLDELESPKKLLELKKDLRSYQKSLIDCYVSKTGKTENEIKKQLSKNEAMTANQALAWKLIDEIV